MKPLTPGLRKLHEFLKKHPNGTGTLQVAEFMWPDSPAWDKRIGRQVNLPGSMVLRSRAGSMLWALNRLDLAYRHQSRWFGMGSVEPVKVKKIKNCHGCRHLEWVEGEATDPAGFVCNKRDLYDKAESEMIRKMAQESYRKKAKRCYEQK